MRELKLRYFIDLVSNVSARAKADAQVVQQTQTLMQRAVTGTTSKFNDWSGSITKSTQNTAVLVSAITGATSKFDNLDRAISRVGSNTSTERQVGYMRALTQSIDQAIDRARRLRETLARGLERAPEAAAAVAGGYYGGKRVVAPFVNDYSNLESATTDLRVAMLDSTGKVSKDFDAIAAEAKKLGEKLPGGTKDFMMGARALIEQGVPTSVIANGGLRASAYFGALMGQNQYESGTTIAKVREAYGLKDEELPQMADLMQRGRFAFGIAPQDFLEVAKYAAPTYNTMKLTGIDNAKKLLAVQGIAAQVGLENSSFGTNFSQMLNRTSQIDWRMNRKGKEAAEVREMLGEHGIDMQFYNDKGQFGGIENMMTQLAKLRGLKDIEQMKVLNKMFGVEAGRPAQILAMKGMEAYQDSLKKMDAQANLDERIELKMTTFAAKLEALGGTIENVRAQIAGQLGEKSKPIMDRLADGISGPLQGFFERNPTAGSVGLVGAGAAGTYLSGRLGLGLLQRFMGGGAAATGAGGAVEAASSGGVATANAAASGASRLGMFARGLGGLNPLMLLEMLTGPDDDDIERLRAMDRRKAGFRGNGFDDPRRLDRAMAGAPQGASFLGGLNVPGLDFLTLTAPGASPAEIKPGQQTEVKVGEGRISLDVRVSDERVSAVAFVTQQPSLVRIDAGGTNPGGFGR